jgi:oxygen-independent coproporphyrinogen-3 oxidase
MPRSGVYLHVPFCSVRCGYCDFNTYTAAELGEGATRASYADTAIGEIHRLRERIGPRVDTVFFGGGTPTQLSAADLVRMLAAIEGLADDAEVTTEANPDSVTAQSLRELRAGGFTRISFGVQSAVPHVLATLERTHDPANVPQAVAWAREAGFEQVSVDLIYGTPGETLDDWRRSLDQALALEPDHISAYALIVEQGTALARRIARAEIAAPDDDLMADKYLLADARLTAEGWEWYELSNWAREDSARCRHNELYWGSADERGEWLGIGPGAHSFAGGVRWWNIKHPAAYAQRLAAGELPEADREVIDADTARVERIMLGLRLREGLPVADLGDIGGFVDDGLLQVAAGRASLTLEGRLLADHVIRELV